MKIEPIFSENVSGVFVASTLDTRKPKETYPIAVRVTYLRKVWYYQTGTTLTYEDYEKVVRANKGKGDFSKIKEQIKPIQEKVSNAVRELINANRFSLEVLKNEIGKRGAVSKSPLLDHWNEIRDSKQKEKTREQYRQAATNFYKFLGCKTQRDAETKRLILIGSKVSIMPKDITPELIQEWDQSMAENGLSTASRSVYLRAFRAVLRELQQNGIIRDMPNMTIKQGGRRTDDYMPVEDIVKVRGYSSEWADWWIILYLCNGANLRDIAGLTWPRDTENEFSFKRSKTADKKPVTVHIPIIPALQKLLDKYASLREQGQRVFPQILLNAESETAITNRVHDFNADIRKGMQTVCTELDTKPATASTARNSYITTLTWHGISDAFIDNMVGHSDGKNILRGYQGKISPKRRARINNLLFVDPEKDSSTDLIERLKELKPSELKQILGKL
jgi:site-specific recombinase XerD